MSVFLSEDFPNSVHFEEVKYRFAIPNGYKFKKMKLTVEPGDLIVRGDSVGLVTKKVEIEDKTFPGTFFLIVEKI